MIYIKGKKKHQKTLSVAYTVLSNHLSISSVQLLSRIWLCDPMDCSLPGSSVHGIFQARVLKWGTVLIDVNFQFSSIAQSCLTLCNPMNRSMPGLPVHHQLLQSTQTHVHRVSDAIQSSHPLSSTSPPDLNLSQHQGLFQWVSSSHQVAKVLEFQLQHQSYQWTPRTDL